MPTTTGGADASTGYIDGLRNSTVERNGSLRGGVAEFGSAAKPNTGCRGWHLTPVPCVVSMADTLSSGGDDPLFSLNLRPGGTTTLFSGFGKGAGFGVKPRNQVCSTHQPKFKGGFSFAVSYPAPRRCQLLERYSSTRRSLYVFPASDVKEKQTAACGNRPLTLRLFLRVVRLVH